MTPPPNASAETPVTRTPAARTPAARTSVGCASAALVPPAATVQKRLIAWFARHARPLEWRQPATPYRVWVAEAMLQQTQVETVKPYYQRWMQRWPTLTQLAQAPENEVLKLWEGLGYYARARRLHQAIRYVHANLQGQIPKDLASLRRLPGIGRYTAGAILSIGHNLPAPIVEGNVLRVLSRLYRIETRWPSAAAEKQLWQLAETLVPSKNPRDFNQALMELGALVCRPQKPHCLLCPLAEFCQARQHGLVDQLPRKQAPRPPRTIRGIALQVTRNSLQSNRQRAWLLRQRPTQDHGDGRGSGRRSFLWGGLWELPWLETQNDESPSHTCQRLLNDIWPQGKASPKPTQLTPQPSSRPPVQHTLSHRHFILHRFTLHYQAPSDNNPLPENYRWLTQEDIQQRALTRLAHKLQDDLWVP